MGAIPDTSFEDIFILLIGRDPSLASMFTQCIAKKLPKKCHLQVLSDYEESLNELNRYNYEYIFLDLLILESGGLLSINDISSRRSNSKIILFVSKEKEDIAAKSLFAGAHDYLIKEDVTADSLNDFLTKMISSQIIVDKDTRCEEFINNLVESIPGAVLLTDLRGKSLYISDQVLELYAAASREELIGKNVFNFVVESQRERAINEFNEMLSTGIMPKTEYEIKRIDDSILFISANGTLLKDRDNQPYASIFTIWDITNTHHFQNELILSKTILEQTVKERTVELERTNEKLKQYIDRHRQAEYLTNISYDLALALCISSNLTDALRLAVDAAILVSKMDCGSIYILNDEAKTFDLAFQRGNTPQYIKQAISYDFESDFVQLMFASKPVYGMFNETGIKLNDTLIREGLKASALLPLIHQGKLVGSMLIASKTLKEVPFIIRQSLETIAVQIAGIIARFKVEDMSVRSEEKLRSHFNSIPVPTYILEIKDDEIVLKEHNEAAKNFAVDKFEEFRGIKSIDFLKNNDEAYKSILECLSERKNCEIEIEYQSKTIDRPNNLLLKMVYLHDAQVLLHAMDVTEIRNAEEILKDYSTTLEEKVKQRTIELENAYNILLDEMAQRQRAEQELVESEKRYRSLIEAKGDLIGEIDLDGYITYISPQVIQTLGYTKEEILNKKNISEIILKDGQQRVENLIAQYHSQPTFIRAAELSLKRKNGEVLVFEVSIIPIFNEMGKLSGLRGLGSDVTSKIEAAERISKIQTSLEQKAMELEAINKEFEHYSYVVSHDLKEPLRTIYSSAEYLKKDLLTILDDSQLKYFEYLSEAVKRSFDYIEGLLALSRIGRIRKTIDEIDMKIFLRGLLISLNLPANVNIIYSDSLPSIESDTILLQQIFQNLINNAVKFNDSARKTVEIGCDSTDGNSIRFFVKDNGRGIDPVNYDKIFKVFEKVHIKDNDEGMGLGLAIVKKAVSQLNGKVQVESILGEGSIFYVTLPKKQTLDVAAI